MVPACVFTHRAWAWQLSAALGRECTDSGMRANQEDALGEAVGTPSCIHRVDASSPAYTGRCCTRRLGAPELAVWMDGKEKGSSGFIIDGDQALIPEEHIVHGGEDSSDADHGGMRGTYSERAGASAVCLKAVGIHRPPPARNTQLSAKQPDNG
ncbi:hypothetical protein B0H13DRAFT_1883525 [Mycena leptocephala]|nr:hypothetical protein B0H13DRAFT_1883525 [Mycena leptocephala]